MPVAGALRRKKHSQVRVVTEMFAGAKSPSDARLKHMQRPFVLALLCFACGSHENSTDVDSSTATTAVTTQEPTVVTVTEETAVITGGQPEFCDDQESIAEEEFPTTIAESVCSMRKKCGCPSGEDPQCGQDYLAYFSDVRSYAAADGLMYDGVCLAQMIREYQEAGCYASEVNVRESCEHCYVYSGTALSGDVCGAVDPLYDFGMVSTCHDDSVECYLNSCQPPGADEGEKCYGTKRCSDGLACNPAGLVCTKADVGDPCLSATENGVGCASQLWCEQSLCQQRKPVGSVCASDSECTTVRCVNGTCADFVIVCESENPWYWPYYIPGPP